MGKRVAYTRRPSRHAAHSNLEVIAEEESGRRTPTTSPALGGHSPGSRRRALQMKNTHTKTSHGKKQSPSASKACSAQSKAQRIMAWMTQRLASSFKQYLAANGGSITFSSESLGKFFAENPDQKTTVESHPGLLGSMLAGTEGVCVLAGEQGRLIALTSA